MKSRIVSLVLAAYLGGGFLSAQDRPSSVFTPVSNEINSSLPSWLRFSGEERGRFESLTGEGFKLVDDQYFLNRLRLNMLMNVAPWLRFNFQAEDSRVFSQNTLPAPASQKDALDLRLGYAEIGNPEGAVMLRAGRQSLDFGDGRLLADPNWSNVGKSFDAARVTLRHGWLKLDLFTAAAVKVDPVNFDEPVPGEHFDGAYGSLKFLPNSVVEPYVFWRMEHNYKSEEGKVGNLDEKTAGVRWAGELPVRFDYTAEMALQRGTWAGDRVASWMGHWVIGHKLNGGVHMPRVYVEYAYASGDAKAKDNTRGTFDSLFPSAHDKYGLTDLFCSSNIMHFRPGFQYTVRAGLAVGAAYNNYWLANAHDGLYVSSKAVASSPSGAAGTHVGQEADIQAQWALFRVTQINAGYGRLFPGEFLRRTATGVPYSIVFLGVTQKF